VALRVKCKCGKSLKVSSKLADKRIACPACQRPFRIPAAKFKAARTKATASKSAASSSAATAPARSAPAAPTPFNNPAAGPVPSSLDDDLLNELSGDYDESQSDILTELDVDATQSLSAGAAPKAVLVEMAAPELGYARDEHRTPTSRRLADPIQGPTRTFWADAFRSFIYPVASGGNAITLVIVCLIASVQVFFAGGCLGFIASSIIFGWLAAMYFSVIQETAVGSEDLPGIKMESGFMEDIIKPGLKYIGAFAVVLAPALLLSIPVATGALPSSWSWMILAWGVAGIFLLPMSLLMFAFDALGMMFRLDLIFTTIFRSILPYLAIWLMLLIVGVGQVVSVFGAEVIDEIFPSVLLSDSVSPVLASVGGHIALIAFGVYLNIVSMRIIGLYYLHFKKRFTIVME